MKISFKRKILNEFNKLLDFTGLELIKKDREFQDYIPLKPTLKYAEQSGMSLGDYIDTNYNLLGVSQNTIDQLVSLGAISPKARRICEIGPGSGRYLEKVKQICDPDYYEIYETSKSWRKYLVDKFHVMSQPTDGNSLSSTPDRSIDLVHSHKVLYGNPVITIFSYLLEMMRVVKDDGYIVFDLLTEDCMKDEILDKWIQSGVKHACGMTPKQHAIDFFKRRGFRYDGGFIVPLAPGVTEYFVFKKDGS
jgi:hypothetical protein